MRIRILSDLHREFGPTEIPALQADLLILAGDIATKQNALPWIRELSSGTPAAYICGNHEFYGGKLPREAEKLTEASIGTNLHILEDSFFCIEGLFVYGCTLWTDMALHGDWRDGCGAAGARMNDYKRIRNSTRGYKRLAPVDTRAIHLLSLHKMGVFLETHDPSQTIVVTHHAPSALSLPVERRNQSISCAYASNLDGFIRQHQPAIWIHGHIHCSQDYQIGQTRVLANPQGYPDNPNPGFNPALIVEI